MSPRPRHGKSAVDPASWAWHVGCSWEGHAASFQVADRSSPGGSCASRPSGGRRSGRGDRAPHHAFEAACLPHQPELFGVAMRICRDPDTAKDLVQETLLRAMVAWDSFEPGSNLRAWLFRILTNAFINGYRKRRRHQRFATERPGDALIALYGRDQDRTDDLEDAARTATSSATRSRRARPPRAGLPRRRRARGPQGREVQGHRRRAPRADRHGDVAPVPRAARARDRARGLCRQGVRHSARCLVVALADAGAHRRVARREVLPVRSPRESV